MAGPATIPASKAARTAAREARQLRRMRRSVDRYPWQQLVVPAVYAVVMGALYRRWWQGLPFAAFLYLLTVWTWRPGGALRKRLAARYLGFRPNQVRGPRSRAQVVSLATLVAFLVITLMIVAVFANEWVHTETACPTPDGYNYADARWGWTPPGLTCGPVADVSGNVVPGSAPSPWRWLAVAAPIGGLGAVVVMYRRARRERTAQGSRRGSTLAPGVAGEVRVIEFFDERRRGSPAVDFGYPWLEGERSAWRVRWLPPTGELVAFRLAWSASSSPLAWTGAPPWPTVTAITVLLVVSDEAWIRRRLAGYEEYVRRPDGWEWLRSRVGDA